MWWQQWTGKERMKGLGRQFATSSFNVGDWDGGGRREGKEEEKIVSTVALKEPGRDGVRWC